MTPALQTHILELLPGLVKEINTRGPFLGRMGAERYYQNNGALELARMAFDRLKHFHNWLTEPDLERLKYELYDLVKAWLNATGTEVEEPRLYPGMRSGKYLPNPVYSQEGDMFFNDATGEVNYLCDGAWVKALA